MFPWNDQSINTVSRPSEVWATPEEISRDNSVPSSCGARSSRIRQHFEPAQGTGQEYRIGRSLEYVAFGADDVYFHNAREGEGL